MNEYVKPELELVMLVSEPVTSEEPGGDMGMEDIPSGGIDW